MYRHCGKAAFSVYHARPLDANGQPTGEAFTIQETASNQQSPAIAYSSGNRYQLAWQDDGTGPWDLFTATLDRSYQVTHIEYEYDPLGRLTSADYHGDFNGSYTYTYDAVGNRTSYTTSIEETIVTTYQYDDANQLTESIEVGGDTTSYEWDDAGRLMTTAVGSNVTRLYTYNQRGNLTAATVDGLLTTFVYDGNGHRLRMSVGSEITTYTLDYAAGFRVLLEQGGASSTTKHYLYGLACIGEQVDVGDAQNSQWRYYHQDGNRLVRQTTNEDAEVTLAWTYSPEGAIVIGEEGPVTHLGCDGNTTYDFSTGLIFKNGNYFDPNTGIWLTMGGLVVWNGRQTRPSNRRQRKRSRKWLLLLLFFLIVLLLTGCGQTPGATLTPTSTPCPTPSIPGLPSNTPSIPTYTPGAPSTPTKIPTSLPPTGTPTPLPTKTVFFAGSFGDGINPMTGKSYMEENGPVRETQTPFWDSIADYWYEYPGHRNNGLNGKNLQADNAMADFQQLKNYNLLVIGYSAGADTALIFAQKYYEKIDTEGGSGNITGLALLGPTLSNPQVSSNDLAYSNLSTNWQNILNDLLVNRGTDVYILNDGGFAGDTFSASHYTAPGNAQGRLLHEIRDKDYDPNTITQEHINDYHDPDSYGFQQGWTPNATNNSEAFFNHVMQWFSGN